MTIKRYIIILGLVIPITSIGQTDTVFSTAYKNNVKSLYFNEAVIKEGTKVFTPLDQVKNLKNVTELYVSNYSNKLKEIYFTKNNITGLYIAVVENAPSSYLNFPKLKRLYLLSQDSEKRSKFGLPHFYDLGEFNGLKEIAVQTINGLTFIPENISEIDSLQKLSVFSCSETLMLPIGLITKPNIELLHLIHYNKSTPIYPDIINYYSLGLIKPDFINPGELNQLNKLVDKKNKTISDGVFSNVYRNGNTLISGELKKGMPHGEWIFYYPNGNVFSIRNYKNGLETGKWHELNKSGDTTKTLMFKKGKLISLEKTVFFDGTKLIDYTILEYDFNNGIPSKGIITCYYKGSQNKKSESIITNSYMARNSAQNLFVGEVVKVPFKGDQALKMDYTYKYWDSNGKLSQEHQFEKGNVKN